VSRTVKRRVHPWPGASVPLPASRFVVVPGTVPAPVNAGLTVHCAALAPPLGLAAGRPLSEMAGLPSGKASGSRSVTCRLVSGTVPTFAATIVKGTSNAVGPTTTGVPASLATPTRWGAIVSVSVAVLLTGAGSVTPGGGVIDTVLVTLRAAPAPTVALSVNVAAPPAARLTEAATLPAPLAGHSDPGVAVHVQPPKARPVGAVSVTVAPTTAVGPALVTTMV
jgi:hypothetical protein